VTTTLARVPRALAEPLVLMVAPLAPHIAEELWHRLGHPNSLACEPFPQADPALAAEDTVTLPGHQVRYRPRPGSAPSRRRETRWGRCGSTGSTGASGRAERARLAVARGPRTAAISWNMTTLLALAD
jgi:Anticodon-binding domain of tRNA ligase